MLFFKTDKLNTMRKCLLFTVLAIGIATNLAHAQGQPCDTINSPVPGNWTSNNYTAPGFFGIIGYIAGLNEYGFTRQANYFDLSATSNTHILGAVIKFTKANSNVATRLDSLVYFRVYADDAGKPGAELTTTSTAAQLPLSQIKANVAAGLNTNINFPSAIALPASKKFYVAVDLSHFQWLNGIRDSVCIAATGDDEVTNSAWDFDPDPAPGKWKAYPKDWDNPTNSNNTLDVALYIFPYVATSASGCGLLPVKLLSFDAVRTASNVALTWKISDEINMKGYQVEKAGNNGVYTSIAYIPAINSLKNQQYSMVDKNAFTSSKTVQYRIKQMDGDGSIQYSRTITLNGSAAITDVVFANPFSGGLKLQLNLAEQQTVSLKMYDMQGRLAASQSPTMYNASNNVINFNGAASLKPGTYLLHVMAGSEGKVYKVVKQ